MSLKRLPARRAAPRRKDPRTTIWTARAQIDLRSIGDYIARADTRAADRWVTRLIAAADKASLLPFAGRRVPELANDDIREVLVGAYRIMYRVTDDRVVILALIEGHRRRAGFVIDVDDLPSL